MQNFNLQNYVLPKSDLDPLHTPHAEFEISDDKIIVRADDGNESSWGHSTFTVGDDNMVQVVEDYGRDCFDETLAFAIYGDSVMGSSDPDGSNWKKPDLSKISPITLHTFKLALQAYLNEWEQRSLEAIANS